MVDINKQYTYNGKPVRIYADGSDTACGYIHCAFINEAGNWAICTCNESDLVEAWEPKEESISMTKEKLYIQMKSSCGINEDEATYYLDKFFQSNVVIPRGESPHPYADVLHEWIEGSEMQWRDSEFDEWCLNPRFKDCEYRIKPSEPVYEWQWCVTMQDGEGSIYGYHTEEGINEIFPTLSKIKIGSTKRERR